MAITDKLTDTFNAANPNVAKVTATRAAAGATLTCDSLSGWPVSATSPVHFATYQVDTSGNVIAGTQVDWKGLVTSSTTIGSLTRQAGATDSGNSIGDYVEMLPTGSFGHDLYTALTKEHSQSDGTHKLTQLVDTNGNEFIKFAQTASAVNEVTVTNAATGNAPSIAATGNDTNIDVKITPKGTGRVVLNGAGAPQAAYVATSQTTVSTSYADLATTTDSVTVTVGSSGCAEVFISCGLMANSAATGLVYVSFVVSGANTQAASDTFSISNQSFANNGQLGLGAPFLLTGLTAGSTTFKLKYRVNGSTGTFQDRRIAVIPL